MEFSKILAGVLIGAVLGVSATLYTLNERLVRVESKLEMLEQNLGNRLQVLEQNDRKIETAQQNLGKHLQVLEQEKRQSSNPVSSLSTTQTKRVILHEPFDSNVLGWVLGEWSELNRKDYIANGKYHFKIQQNNSSAHHSSIELTSLPLNYDIELVSQWQSGNKDELYGLFFGNDDNNFYIFVITYSGYASVWLYKKSKWEKNPINPIGGFSSQPSRYTKQVLKVRTDEFSYYVNDKLVGKGYIGEVGLGKIGMFVQNSQEIAFDRLSIFEK